MKILNKKQFLELPAGVIYSKFEPCIIGDICVKGNSIEDIDWFYLNVIDSVDNASASSSDILFSAMEKGTPVSFDYYSTSRDGFFDQEQLFLVYEKEDVVKLNNYISSLIPEYPEI